MKIHYLIIAFLALSTASIYCGGLTEDNLVNVQEIELDGINSIDIAYSYENISLFKGNTDTFIIKEYMSIDKTDYYARISHSGDRVRIEKGKRPFGIGTGILFNVFNVRVEVYLPASYTKNLAVKTSSGNVAAGDDYFCSGIKIESSSGNISVNTITADNITLAASSGRIRGESINGNTGIRTSSGNIVLGNINGDITAKSSSGRIVMNQVTGSVTAEASSGDIRCLVTEGAGDIVLTTSSGNVTLDMPKNLAFNFSSRTSSGSLSTPFPDKLFSPVSDRRLVQGSIGTENTPDISPDITIKTNSGSIKVNWTI
jgi:hypothetical protein